MKNANIMIDCIIAQYGYESPYTISFCQMVEDYEQHGLFSEDSIYKYYEVLLEN